MERKTSILSRERKASLKKRKRFKRLFGFTAVIVLIATAAALILPAISDAKDTYCGLEEHVHTDSCYEEKLVCGFSDAAADTSNDSTADTSVQEASETEASPEAEAAHTHTAECYKALLTCSLPEHSHTLSCMSDPTADVESLDSIESMMINTELCGDDGEDILKVARSQLGYTESSLNFAVEADGISKRGYTRYGAWYGDNYADWNSIFISFCAHFADVDVLESTDQCADWITMLKDSSDSLYYDATDHTPLPGDVIFFDTDGDGTADRAGIVDSITEGADGAYVIEGDKDDRVASTLYRFSDDSIIGYIKLATPKNTSGALLSVGGVQMFCPEGLSVYQYGSHKIGTDNGAEGSPTVTYVLMPYDDYTAGNRAPNLINWSAAADANYTVAYSIGESTALTYGGRLYIAKNVFNSDYADRATVLSGIVANAYPYVTAEQMRAALAEAYENGEIPADLSCCTEAEFIAAAQWAIWDAAGLSDGQTRAFGSAFPSDNSEVLNPLTNAGHSDEGEIQTHVKDIRDWLMTKTVSAPISILNDNSKIEKKADGTYTVTSVITLSRPAEAGEVITVKKTVGDTAVTDTVCGEGTEKITVTFTGLNEAEVLRTGVELAVSSERTHVFLYDGDGDQDMIGGRYGVDSYSLSLEIKAETTRVDVAKYWSDGHPGIDSVKAQLYADGKAYGDPVTLSEENGWTYSWSDLIKYKAPETPILYTVGEITVPGYLTTAQRTEGDTVSYSFTSTLSDRTTSLKVKNEWTGHPDGKYPESVTVQLLQNGETYGDTIVLNSDNSWSYVWEDLPEALGGETYTYSVKETEINGYTAEMIRSENSEGIPLITIVNKWTPDHLPVKLIKVDMYDHSILLPGAAFELYRVSDSESASAIPGTVGITGVKERTFITGDGGAFLLEDILVGETYYLVEIGSPKGYVIIDEPIVLSPEKDKDNDSVLRITEGENVTVAYETDDGETVLLVENHINYVIPETGGNGTVIFYTSGLLLIITAALLITIKNKNKTFRRKTK